MADVIYHFSVGERVRFIIDPNALGVTGEADSVTRTQEFDVTEVREAPGECSSGVILEVARVGDGWTGHFNGWDSGWFVPAEQDDGRPWTPVVGWTRGANRAAHVTGRRRER